MILEKINQALAILSGFLEKNPSKWAYTSSKEQLEYLKQCLENNHKIEKELNIGLIAAREFENLHPELAHLIYSITSWIRKNK